MKNEPFVEILSYCVVRIPYILLWESLNKYFTQKLHPCFNKIPHTKYAVFEIGVKKVIRKICLWNLNHLSKKKNLDCQRNFWN